MKINIAGIGIVGSFGTGLSDFKKAKINNVDFFSCKANVDKISEFFPSRNLRRIDHFSKMTILSACMAIEDAGFKIENIKEQNVGVILATGHGAMNSTYAFKDSINQNGDAFASPTYFSMSVHNSAMTNLTIQLGIKGPNLTISQHSFSFQSALLTASLWLTERICDFVIVAGVDELSEPLKYCIERFNKEKDIKLLFPNPYIKKNPPGEGASCLILKNSDTGSQKGNNYGIISEIKTGNILHDDLIPKLDSCLMVDRNSVETLAWLKENKIQNKILSLENNYGHFMTDFGFHLIEAVLKLENETSITFLNIVEENQYFMIKFNQVASGRTGDLKLQTAQSKHKNADFIN